MVHPKASNATPVQNAKSKCTYTIKFNALFAADLVTS
jgi:hypothetical protein